MKTYKPKKMMTKKELENIKNIFSKPSKEIKNESYGHENNIK